MTEFKFDERTDYEQTLVMIYFSFTTLTTVGFGDFHPRSDGERLFMAFNLLFGVMIFSIIMGNYMEIAEEIRHFDDDNEEGDELTKFFMVL